jgi:ferrous iron transport protein B
VALLGNPNVGKSTLFTALSGLTTRTGNYPGVTVEKKVGSFTAAGCNITLIDLPGTYSLSPRSLDEMVAVDVLLGRSPGVAVPDVVVCIVDASNLERNLYMVSQVIDAGRPIVLALNMVDVAASKGIVIDAAALSRRLGVPVVATAAHRREGIDTLKTAIVQAGSSSPPPRPALFPPAFDAECQALRQHLAASGLPDAPLYIRERLLLDVHGWLEQHFATGDAARNLGEYLTAARQRLKEAGCRIPAIEAIVRYKWCRELLDGVATAPSVRPVTRTDRLDRVLTHPVLGLFIFVLVMFVVFQSIFTFAQPLMDANNDAFKWLGAQVAGVIPRGPLQSLIVDGVIAGVGAVLVFLPQICILFAFIAVLEDCGYMARAAFLMDRLMTQVGLSGKSFVPLMSSFACAIPGIMAARTIENRRDRMTTILIAPLMSCSARQPVYLLMIGTLISADAYLWGWVPVPVLVLLAATFFGAFVAIPIAWVLKKTVFRGETPPFVMELPSYKWPSPRVVFDRVWQQAGSFVTRAGTLIFATAVLVWAASYFPGDRTASNTLAGQIEARTAELEKTGLTRDEIEQDEQLAALQAGQFKADGELLANSYLGRFGRSIEPAFEPLGWNWKIAVGVIASFPAREVIVGTLGTIYSLGGEVDEESDDLKTALRADAWPDGSPVFTLPVGVSIVVFFALCAQCASTLMVIRRETGSWGWAAFTFVYMTTLAYAGAFVAFNVTRMIFPG